MYTEERTLEVLDVPAQPVAPGEVSLCVSAAGICGSLTLACRFSPFTTNL